MPARPPDSPSVVLLADGGAKGFAHLKVLRQIERDHIPTARIVCTSMGVVMACVTAACPPTRSSAWSVVWTRPRWRWISSTGWRCPCIPVPTRKNNRLSWNSASRAGAGFSTKVDGVTLNQAQDRVTLDCGNCLSPSQLILGGFRNTVADRMEPLASGQLASGQLAGDQLAHVLSANMYRLTHGGLFLQKIHLSTVLKAGDAWYMGDAIR